MPLKYCKIQFTNQQIDSPECRAKDFTVEALLVLSDFWSIPVIWDCTVWVDIHVYLEMVGRFIVEYCIAFT